MKVVGILSAILSAACTSVPAVPPFSVANEWGIARARTPELAEQLSTSIATVAPQVAATLPYLERKPLDVRLLPRLTVDCDFDLHGICAQSPSAAWIEIKEGSSVQQDATLSHEIVHLWLGPDWDPLPPAMEDGIANFVEQALFPEYMVGTQLKFVVLMSTAISGSFRFDSNGDAVGRRSLPRAYSVRSGSLSGGIATVGEGLDLDEVAFRSVEDQTRYFEIVAFGSLLVSRIGIEPLHQLCLRADREGLKQVPSDWILDAAGLSDADMLTWIDAILELYGPAEKDELLRRPAWLGFKGGASPDSPRPPSTNE